MRHSPATRLHVGQKRSLVVAALIAPLLVMLAMIATTSPAMASGRGHGISVSPDNGPAGTHVTVSGSGFGGGSSASIGYSSGDCSSGVTTITGATATIGSDGNLRITIQWPSTQPGDYHVCVTVGGTTSPSDNVFHATSASAPAITVSSPVAAGGQVTVTGSNFTLNGSQTAEVLYGAAGSNGCATSVGTAAITNGGFTLTFNAPFVTQTTQYVVTAVVPQGSCATTPTVSAQGNLTVNGATPTATTSVGTGTGTGTNTGGSGQGTGTGTTGTTGLVWPPTWPPSGAWSAVYCLVGLLLLLLIVLLLLLFARNRRKEEPVTIQERDTVTVQGNGQQPGNAAVQREVYSVDPRTGRQVRIAEEVTSFEEVPPDEPPARGY